MRLRETENEYGTPVVEFLCGTCGVAFTICPAPPPEKDPLHEHCGARECASYDPRFDVSRLFEEGVVRADGDGRLIPYRVIEGGKT